MKKLVTLFVLLLSSIGMSAQNFEVEGIKYSVVSAEDLTVQVTGYNSSYEGDIILNGMVEYEGQNYEVLSIKNFAIYSCKKLISIGDLSACTSIGNNAFYQCGNLTSIGDLSACTSIGNDAFYQCGSLTSIGDLSACTSIGGSAFQYCSSLTSIGDLSACTSIGGSAFYQCGSLTSIGDLSDCTTIGQYAFNNCGSLTSVGDLSDCTTIGQYAFSGCGSLTSIGDLSACTSIGDQAFRECGSLTSIGDLSACTSIGGYAFYQCGSLTSIGDLSACTSIGGFAFSGCGVECVTLPATPPTLTETFCDNGTTFLVPDDALEIYRSADYWKDIRMQIIGQNAQHVWDVQAPVLDGIGQNNLVNVMTLKVSGNIDSEDIMFMRNNMYNLHHLDLTDATIMASDREYASGRKTQANSVGGLYELLRLRSVSLPTSAKSIEGDAFHGCRYLSDVTIPEGIERIDNGSGSSGNPRGAFTACGIKTITLPSSLSYIGRFAFATGDNSNAPKLPLQSIVFNDGLETIGEYAFRNCQNLTSVALPIGLTTIEGSAFDICSTLASVIFPSTLQTIGNKAFSGCPISSVSLPTGLVSIAYQAFKGNNALTELHIPASVESIGENVFNGCSNLKDVYVYVVDPINMNTNTFSSYASATLHVPEQSESTYFRNAQWGQFADIVTFNEPYSYFYISNDYTLPEGKRFTAETQSGAKYFNTGYTQPLGQPNRAQTQSGITFKGNAGSSFTIEGSGDQELGEMNLYNDGTKTAAVIADENLTATGVNFYIPVTGNKWRFFAFPFRVQLQNVTAPGEYVFRRYDGAQRAQQGTTGWAELEAGTEWLEPGVGYIFQSSQSGTLEIHVDNPDFYWHGENKHNELQAYVADNIQHASWNFIGNPLTSYYDINDLSYTAPLTIWNGSSYVAYRPGDDNYQLSPFEAFFVQKPEGSEQPTYEKDYRMGYNGAQQAHSNKVRRHDVEPNDRLLVNLILSDGINADQTRVVFNAKQSADYDLGCDAAKFMSTDVPQLYSLGQDVRYAINERPQGSVNLGFIAPQAGTYTIATTRMDEHVALKDLLMGTTHDLQNGEYTFDTEAGAWENRFVLIPANSVATAITEAEIDQQGTNTVYSLDGKLLPQSDLPQGIVVVKQNSQTKKVVNY